MVQIGFKCDKGIMRQNNEDACFVVPGRNVYVVADGVGGNNSGEVASRTAVSEIARMVNEAAMDQYRSPEEIFGFFADIIEDVNEQIYQMGLQSQQNRGMATTIVTAYIRMNSAYIAIARSCLLKGGGYDVPRAARLLLEDFRSGKLGQITRDHTYVNELIDKGVITEDEAEHHDQKNVITKALGTEHRADPDFYKVDLESNDILLLCSDGLYGEVPAEKIAQILKTDQNMNDMCTSLVQEALAAGGRDNITVICLKI